MKTIRWLAAGAVLTLLALLLFLRMNSGPRAESSSRVESPAVLAAVPATPAPAPVSSVPASRVSPVPAAVSSPTSPLFESWVREYISADAAHRAILLPAGEAMVQARRAEMAELIRTNPEEAIQRALPYSVRKQLPEAILSQIEQPLSARGEFRPVYARPLPGRESEVPATTYEVVVNTKTDGVQPAAAKKTTYETYTYGARRDQPAHRNAYLHGVTVKEHASGKSLLALSADGPPSGQ